MFKQSSNPSTHKQEQESQMKLFGQIMKFFGSFLGNGEKQPLMITNQVSQMETITLKVSLPEERIKFLFPTPTSIKIGIEMHSYRCSEAEHDVVLGRKLPQ